MGFISELRKPRTLLWSQLSRHITVDMILDRMVNYMIIDVVIECYTNY